MRRRSKRSLGHSMVEIVFATALAGVLLGVHGGELHRQQIVLRTVNEEAAARGALLTAYERLRAGLLGPPPVPGPVALEAPRLVKLTIERLPSTLDHVVSVRLRAEWGAERGTTHRRELITLVEERAHD